MSDDKIANNRIKNQCLSLRRIGKTQLAHKINMPPETWCFR